MIAINFDWWRQFLFLLILLRINSKLRIWVESRTWISWKGNGTVMVYLWQKEDARFKSCGLSVIRNTGRILFWINYIAGFSASINRWKIELSCGRKISILIWKTVENENFCKKIKNTPFRWEIYKNQAKWGKKSIWNKYLSIFYWCSKWLKSTRKYVENLL